MFLHVLKASSSNGSKNKKWYFFGRKLWPPLTYILYVFIYENIPRIEDYFFFLFMVVKLHRFLGVKFLLELHCLSLFLMDLYMYSELFAKNRKSKIKSFKKLNHLK